MGFVINLRVLLALLPLRCMWESHTFRTKSSGIPDQILWAPSVSVTLCFIFFWGGGGQTFVTKSGGIRHKSSIVGAVTVTAAVVITCINFLDNIFVTKCSGIRHKSCGCRWRRFHRAVLGGGSKQI